MKNRIFIFIFPLLLAFPVGLSAQSNSSPSEPSTQMSSPYFQSLGEISYTLSHRSPRKPSFEGWGVSLCWWANMCGRWSEDKIDELVDWLVSPQGLNYRIFRYNIGGGDDPLNRNCTPHHMGKGKGLRAEMEGFKDRTDGPYIYGSAIVPNGKLC